MLEDTRVNCRSASTWVTTFGDFPNVTSTRSQDPNLNALVSHQYVRARRVFFEAGEAVILSLVH
jgi:hypothetical protein